MTCVTNHGLLNYGIPGIFLWMPQQNRQGGAGGVSDIDGRVSGNGVTESGRGMARERELQMLQDEEDFFLILSMLQYA